MVDNIFAKYDTDKNGTLERNEVYNMVKDMISQRKCS